MDVAIGSRINRKESLIIVNMQGLTGKYCLVIVAALSFNEDRFPSPRRDDGTM